MALDIGVIADFNADNLVRVMSRQGRPLGVHVSAAPFGQPMQTLLQRSAPFWECRYDAVVLWTFPGAVVPRFQDVLELERWAPEDLDEGIDAFAEIVRALESRVGRVFLATSVASGFDAQRPSAEMRSGVGASAAMLL